MSYQPDLFSDEINTFKKKVASNPTTALKLSEQDVQLSPDQKRFNRLLGRVEKLKNQLVETQMLCDLHRPVYHKVLAPLRERHRVLMREMVLWLDGRLQRKSLSAKQKCTATMILCNLSFQLVAQGDQEMEILHDKYSAESLAQKEQDAVTEMRTMMEDILGESLGDDASLETMQDVLKVSMERLREAEAAEQEELRQTRSRKKKPAAAQLKAQANLQEAETTLRKVFRQLASALHPDRENDPDERARKTILMSEANAAYDRRDLVALLQIQLRTELANSASIAKMAEEKIVSLTLLLKRQVSELENELEGCRQKACQEFGLESYEKLNVANLRRSLDNEEKYIKQDLAAMQEDLQQIEEDDKYFKQWLKDQKRLFETAPVDIFDDWEMDSFGGR